MVIIITLQVYSIFLESSGNHSIHTFQVRGSDSVGSLMDRVRDKLSELLNMFRSNQYRGDL